MANPELAAQIMERLQAGKRTCEIVRELYVSDSLVHYYKNRLSLSRKDRDKEYRFRNPANGEIVYVSRGQLRDFAEQHNLKFQSLVNLWNQNTPWFTHCQGWTPVHDPGSVRAQRYAKNLMRQSVARQRVSSRVYTFLAPNGQIISTPSIKELVESDTGRQHGLRAAGMSNVWNGYRISHKGWKKYVAE